MRVALQARAALLPLSGTRRRSRTLRLSVRRACPSGISRRGRDLSSRASQGRREGAVHDTREGPLARGEALGIVLVELGEQHNRELATIVFRDWSLQVSTELSPTAGWGLPQNAVEFGRISMEPTSAVYIDLTLAGTSVGRGWDSVGHRAGVSENRVEIHLPPGS